MKKDIGIGLVGTGFMCKAHSNAYHKIGWDFWDEPYRPVLIGVGGICIEDAENAMQRFGYRHGCVGWDALLADPAIDMIDIVVGEQLHKRVALESMQAGKSVVCEKPLTLTVEDAWEMEAAANKYQVRNLCGYNYRFFPAVQLAKSLIDRGLLGKLYCFNGCYCQDQGADDRVPAEKLWYVMGSKASGASNGIGSHLVDMSRFLMGEVGAVSGFTKTYNPTRNSASGEITVKTDEEMLAVLEFTSGASGLYKASAVSAGRKNFLSWEISGSRGSMIFDTENPNVLKVYLQDGPVKELCGFTEVNVTQVDMGHPLVSHFWPRGSGLGWEDAHVCELAHMLACVAENRPVAPEGADFYDGARVVEILDAIRRSQATKTHIYTEPAYSRG